MLKVPKRVADRLRSEVEKYRVIAASQRDRGVAEADTVTLVKDILSDVFGYDKYEELTSEQQIRGTFCDLAVKIDGTARFLIEVKAIGTELNESHLRQVVNYGAQHGIEWLVLTNSAVWRIYRLRFSQPIEWDLVAEFDLFTVSPDTDADRSKLYLLCREGLDQEAMTRFHRHTQQLNRYTLA
ncbi:MAG: type I restriction enzyme HsdR N-terminal domain-containing protein, partial [Planctomycetaceae bacterium]|nr:type I restriction enzyme HsdR N-terminal domain-containing protein [Planctomycetaceae bacterium]